MNNKDIVNWEELIVSNMLQLEAIINILERKNIASKEEILFEVVKVKEEMEKKIRDSQKSN